MNKRQPMAGLRRMLATITPERAFETKEFANRRTKNRARNKQAKASRKRNR